MKSRMEPFCISTRSANSPRRLPASADASQRLTCLMEVRQSIYWKIYAALDRRHRINNPNGRNKALAFGRKLMQCANNIRLHIQSLRHHTGTLSLCDDTPASRDYHVIQDIILLNVIDSEAQARFDLTMFAINSGMERGRPNHSATGENGIQGRYNTWSGLDEDAVIEVEVAVYSRANCYAITSPAPAGGILCHASVKAGMLPVVQKVLSREIMTGGGTALFTRNVHPDGFVPSCLQTATIYSSDYLQQS
jgi:hypothetical protein